MIDDRFKPMERKRLFSHHSVSGTSYFEQGNYLQGLSDWMNVIPQDINNYNAVRAIVEKYGSEYKLHGLLQCAEYKSNGDTTI